MTSGTESGGYETSMPLASGHGLFCLFGLSRGAFSLPPAAGACRQALRTDGADTLEGQALVRRLLRAGRLGPGTREPSKHAGMMQMTNGMILKSAFLRFSVPRLAKGPRLCCTSTSLLLYVVRSLEVRQPTSPKICEYVWVDRWVHGRAQSCCKINATLLPLCVVPSCTSRSQPKRQDPCAIDEGSKQQRQADRATVRTA